MNRTHPSLIEKHKQNAAGEGTTVTSLTLKTVIIVLSAIVIFLLLAYGLGVFYFSSHFLPGTRIDGQDIAYQDAPTVQTSLDDLDRNWQITIEDPLAETTESIPATAIDFTVDSLDLDQLLQEQNAWSWPLAFFTGAEQRDHQRQVTYDETKLQTAVTALDPVSGQFRTASKNATVSYNEGSQLFQIVPETQGTRADGNLIFEGLKPLIVNGQSPTFNLEQAQCYITPTVLQDTPALIEGQEALNRCLDTKITYNIDGLPEVEVLDKTIFAPWLSLDENLAVTIDKDQAAAWLASLGHNYDTVGTSRPFTTINGDTIEVSGGDYGWRTDEATELNQLMIDIPQGREVTRDFPYKATAAGAKGTAEWGTAYLEVDLAAQHAWLLTDGQVTWDSSIVSGNADGRHNTDPGVWFIKEHDRNRTLIGSIDPRTGEPEYRTPVDYWMCFNDIGEGLHDATWRDSFGGDIYTYDGSHGCVNLPYSKAAALFDLVDIGLPVIVHV